jgi:hypothetical protein
MTELIILESLAFFFLLLPIIQPFVIRLRPIDGLVWLPVLALGIIIVMFPAYGFRPECIPLLLYAVFFNIFNVSRILSLVNRVQSNDFSERSRGLTAFLIAILVFVTAVGIYFLPGKEAALISEGVSSVVVYDEEHDNKYFLRIYGQTATDGRETPQAGDGGSPALRPALLVVPPVTGSVMMTDRLCAALRDGGFTVVSYSRPGFDFPAFDRDGKSWMPPVAVMLDIARSYTRGRASVAANNAGRSLETERQNDIRFLLELVRRNRGVPGYTEVPGNETDWSCVFAAGYGAGGSALLSLSGQNAALRGIVVIESEVLSTYRENERPPTPELPHDANWFQSFWAGISGWAATVVSGKVAGLGATPNPQTPVCFIVSSRAQNAKYRDGRYAAITQIFHTATAPAILVSVPGAGIPDYSDVPEKYPFYSALFFSWEEKLWPRTGYIPGTATLIINFAASVMEQEAPDAGAPSLSRKLLDTQALHLESRGALSL